MLGSTSFKLTLSSGAALAVLCVLPGVAQAQTAPTAADQPTAAPATNDADKDIVVTGTRIVAAASSRRRRLPC